MPYHQSLPLADCCTHSNPWHLNSIYVGIPYVWCPSYHMSMGLENLKNVPNTKAKNQRQTGLSCVGNIKNVNLVGWKKKPRTFKIQRPFNLRRLFIHVSYSILGWNYLSPSRLHWLNICSTKIAIKMIFLEWSNSTRKSIKILWTQTFFDPKYTRLTHLLLEA